MSTEILNVRFNNPQYNPRTKKFKIDAEFRCPEPGRKFFGGNIRFIYDSSIFVFSGPGVPKMVDYLAGCGPHLPNPPLVNNSSAGKAMFNFPTSAAAYFNGAVVVGTDPNTPPIVLPHLPGEWIKIFAFELESHTVLSGNQCPSFVWDKKPDPLAVPAGQKPKGGFMAGSDGVTCSLSLPTVIDYQATISCVEYCDQFNWTPYPNATKWPWGAPNTSNCFVI